MIGNGCAFVSICGLVIAGCSSDDSTPSPDDAEAIGMFDSHAPLETTIVGSLGGTSFRLSYAHVKRGATSAEPIWICASDVEVTYAECESTSGPARTIFQGPFIYESTGPRWGFPQVWLYRTGANPSSAYGRSGSLSVVSDEANGLLELRLQVDFGEVTGTLGDVSATP